jgi:hypothetical protein
MLSDRRLACGGNVTRAEDDNAENPFRRSELQSWSERIGLPFTLTSAFVRPDSYLWRGFLIGDTPRMNAPRHLLSAAW